MSWTKSLRVSLKKRFVPYIHDIDHEGFFWRGGGGVGRFGSEVDCLARDRGVAGSILTGSIASLSKTLSTGSSQEDLS